ncbi:MAG: three-Cys-motif partner protein TcmP [Promethearchaeota archaeon]
MNTPVKKGRKIHNFDFHLENIRQLKEDSSFLLKIEDFPKKDHRYYYVRKDQSGWWMVTKQIIIRKYIGAYLNILGSQEDIDLYFIDLMSSWGMNKVTKQEGKHRFIFPGTALSAAIISSNRNKGFKEFYVNDWDSEVRKVLNKRFEKLNNILKYPLIYNIDTSNEKIDSNDWVLSVIKEIKDKHPYKKNYLMVIDNEGMDIHYNTIKKVKETFDFGDIIINFQDVMIARQIHNQDIIKRFFGKNLNSDTKQIELCDIYQDQLRKIGFGRIEPIKIETTGGYYYTLLFCCRKNSSASWLKMIEKYRDDRFKSWNDKNVKHFWDIVSKIIKPLF